MPEQAPLFPVLKPFDWPGREQALCRPLVPPRDLASGPWVGFGYDHSQSIELITHQSLPSGSGGDPLPLIEQAAIRNLHARPAHWRIEEVRLGLFRKMRLLVTSEDPLAAERILDEQFLQDAQDELHTRLLAVGVPCRGLLVAADGSRQDENLSRFAAMVSAQYHRPRSAPISPQVFLVRAGQIIGVATGHEEVGHKLAESQESHAAPVYLNAVVSADRSTGRETLHLLAGGHDFEQISAALHPVFERNLQQMLERDLFSGQVRIVLVPELTPRTPTLESQMAALLARYRAIAVDITQAALAHRPVEVQVLYGSPEPVAVVPAPLPAAKPISTWIAGLESTDPMARRKSAEHIRDLLFTGVLPPEVPNLAAVLIGALDDDDGQVRALAAEALAQTLPAAQAEMHSAVIASLRRLGPAAIRPVQTVLSRMDPAAQPEKKRLLDHLLAELLKK